MNSNKFKDAKEKLVTAASNKAAEYLLIKYGSAHLVGKPRVELTSTEGPTSSSFVFQGRITCYAAPEGLLNQIGVNMTVNENNIEVESTEDIQANVEQALNSAKEAEPVVTASLDSFKLVDNGSKYLQVSHPALEEANLGIVGKNEYASSPNRSELLQSIVKDAMVQTKISFTGEFKEPVIEKQAEPRAPEMGVECDICGKGGEIRAYQLGRGDSQEEWHVHSGCKEKAKDRMEARKEKKSWLTADIMNDTEPPMAGAEFMEYQCPVCLESFEDHDVNLHDKSCPGTPEVMHSDAEKPTLSISEDMPMARMSDHLAQSAQLEEQQLSASQEKIKTEAVNSLINMLHTMGYGSAKVAEVAASKEGLDLMTTLEDAGTTKAVNIPVVIKESTVLLPRKSLVSTLISKGLDIKAKLSEEFSKEVLEKIAAIEELENFKETEANAILAERSTVTKQASGSDNMQTLGDTDTLELQKHLIPGYEDLKKGDKISDGNSQWEIVDTEWQQNDKNENSSSIWKLRKCAPPKSDEKEPETKIKI